MVEPTVLIVPQRLPARLVEEVRTACRQARARCLIGSELATDRLAGGVPRVLVAGLDLGERRIPSDVLSMLRHWSAEASLLLLSQETLTQPTVTLQRGRVTLLGAPLDRRRILHCIRTLLADDQAAVSHVSQGPVRLEAQQKLGPRWWASTVQEAQVGGGMPAPALTVVNDERTCLTSLVRLDPTVAEAATAAAAPAPSAELARAADEAVRRAPGAASCERQLAALTAAGLGVVHLDSENHRWSIYWPRRAGFLHLASPQRLPRVWDLARSFEHLPGRLVTLRAAPADLVVAATASPLDGAPPDADVYAGRDGDGGGDQSEPAPALPVADVDAFVQGGPAVLDWLFERVCRTGFAAVAAEMR